MCKVRPYSCHGPVSRIQARSLCLFHCLAISLTPYDRYRVNAGLNGLFHIHKFSCLVVCNCEILLVDCRYCLVVLKHCSQ